MTVHKLKYPVAAALNRKMKMMRDVPAVGDHIYKFM